MKEISDTFEELAVRYYEDETICMLFPDVIKKKLCDMIADTLYKDCVMRTRKVTTDDLHMDYDHETKNRSRMLTEYRITIYAERKKEEEEEEND